MAKLDQIRTAAPSDFFREIKRVYQRKTTSGHDAEAFVFDDTPSNRKLTSTNPITLSNGQLMVSGSDVELVLGNVLENTFNPVGGGTLVSGSGKLQFRPDLRSDSLNDTRFISQFSTVRVRMVFRTQLYSCCQGSAGLSC